MESSHKSISEIIEKTKWILCHDCGKKTEHMVLSQVSNVDGDVNVTAWTDYYFTQCNGCKSVTLLKEFRFSEYYSPNPYTGENELDVEISLYPSRLQGRKEMTDLFSIPHGIGIIYSETLQAIINNQNILAGIGIRVIVEGVCNDKSSTGRNLKEKINDLANKGFITHDSATILHNLRFMGNRSAHEIKSHGSKELNIAFDIINILLQNVYVMPKKAVEISSSP